MVAQETSPLSSGLNESPCLSSNLSREIMKIYRDKKEWARIVTAHISNRQYKRFNKLYLALALQVSPEEFVEAWNKYAKSIEEHIFIQKLGEQNGN